MFEKLKPYLPEPPAKILYVGCEPGFSADLLRSEGYNLTAVAPGSELIDHAAKHYGSDAADFVALGFFDEDESIFAKDMYDALLFQESLKNLSPLLRVMGKARHLLKNRGVLIIGDEVCYEKTLGSEIPFHMSQDIYAAIAESGFCVIENQKIENENGQLDHEIFVARKDELYLKPYKAGDEEKILEGFNEIFNTNRSLEHWYWKFRDNPYGSHMVCLGVSDEGEIISHFAGYPVPFCSTAEESKEPKYFTSLQAGDTFTHPKVRRKGLGKTGFLARSAYYFYAKFLEGFVPFAYGFNTGNVKKLGERYLGYHYIDPVPYWVKDVSQNPFESPLLFSRLFDGFSVDEVHSVNEEWDELFARLCPAYRFLIKRDAAYIKWRYLDCPDRTYRVFAIRKKGLLVGWGTFSRRNNALIWGDALFERGCLESVSKLLCAILGKYFSDVETIEGWFSPNPRWWSDHLKSIGFEEQQEPDGLTFCYVPYRNNIMDNDLLGEKFNNYFYYTWGDSDLF